MKNELIKQTKNSLQFWQFFATLDIDVSISEFSQYVLFCLFILSANLRAIAILYINRIGVLPCAIQEMAERFHKRVNAILIQFSHSYYVVWRNEQIS